MSTLRELDRLRPLYMVPGDDLIGEVLVGGVAAGAADQPQILAAAHRLTDTGAGGGFLPSGAV